jgi:ketosteroid isomerase-like protein
MSQRNLEIVRSIYSDWERGDYSSASWAHPEIDYVLADGPAPGRWSGLAGMAQAFGDFLSAWDDPRVEAEELRVLDDERVLVIFSRTGRGRTSGVDLSQVQSKGATLFHIRGGKVTRLVVYHDGDCALADLGFSGQG